MVYEMDVKIKFENSLRDFVKTLSNHISTDDGQWSIKGFIDIFKNVYTISSDTKIVSKILEIHLLPKILEFAEKNDYNVVLTDHQNYYPDLTFIRKDNQDIKFAVDIKTTYRNPANPEYCNGFTLGSHGEYFENRQSSKNIQFPYSSYSGHFCLGIIYDRYCAESENQAQIYDIKQLKSIVSTIKNFDFFVNEKWKIASDKSGSGNTSNIGSIKCIADIKSGRGVFCKLGEKWFDDYWMNYNKIIISDSSGRTKKINDLTAFVEYRKGNLDLIVPAKAKSKFSGSKDN